MVSLSMTLSDPTRILTASRGFVSDSWAFLLKSTAVTQTKLDGLTKYIGLLQISCGVCLPKIIETGRQQTKLLAIETV